jgi:tetratricopeptide (TPR) repeat protein
MSNASQGANPGSLSGVEADAQALLARLDRESKALGNVPAAASLFHEMGQLWEQPLKSPRNAAICYQNAFKLDPGFLPNIRSARRLFAEVGNWQMALQLLDAEIAATTDPIARAPLRFERGQLLEDRLNRPDEALAAYEAGLEDSPTDLALLCQLESAYSVRHDDAKLLGVLMRLAEVVTEDKLKAHYYFAASVICEDRLGDDERAGDLLEAAWVLKRRDPVILAAVKRRAEHANAGEALLKALASEAEGLGANAGPAYYQISRIYEKLQRVEDAIGALQAARRVAPSDPLVLSELARLYESFGRWEDLAEVLAARVNVLADAGEKVALLLRLAALYEERLKRDEEAIARYQAVLAVQPGSAAALTALGKLYYRRGDWNGLLGTYEREAATIDELKQRVAPMYKAAEVLEQKLGREEEAMSRYNEVLQLVPGYLPAQKALSRLYEKHKRYAELAAMLEQEVAQTRDRDQAISTLHVVAQLYEEHLNDLDRAVNALQRILELAPEHLPTIRALSRLYERGGRWGEVVRMNDLEGSHTGDTKQIVSLLHRNAEIYEEKLGQVENAVECYKKVLALSPAYLPALKALGRLYGARNRYEDLIQMYRQEADIAPTIDQAANLTFKIGENYEDRLHDLDNAVAAYQEVLTLAPTHLGALRALSRIHRATGRWESLVEVLRHEAAARTDPGERANTLFQAAAIWEDAGRLELSVESYLEVLRLSPAHAASLRALERIYQQQGATPQLIELYERQTQTAASPDDRVAAYAKLARIYQSKRDEPLRAQSCYEAMLVLQPGHLDALKGMERLRGADRVGRVELRKKLSAQVESKPLSGQLLASAAQDLERQGLHDQALPLWKEAYLASPTARTTAGLEAALTRSNDIAGLAALLAQQLEREQDTAARFGLAMRLGRLYEGPINDTGRALNAYVIALRCQASSIPALRAARRIWVSIGDFASARAGLHAEAAATADKAEAVSAWYEAGLLALERLSDPDGAIADFQKALELDPLAAGPAQKLEDLLSKRGGAAPLAALQQRRGEAKMAQGQNDEASRCFLEAAKLYAQQLNQPEAALTAAERALAAVPTHAEALSLMGELCFQAGRFADAARAYASRIEQGGDKAEMAAVHLRLGVIFQDHLNEPERAAAHLQTSLADVPDTLDALERLARIHVEARNWTAAADVLKRLTELPTDPLKQLEHTLALARVYDEGFSDAAQAAQLYRQVLELSPGEPAVFERLAALYQALGQSGELALLLEQQAQRAREPAQIVNLRTQAAKLFSAQGENVKAVASLRFAIEADPTSIEARSSIAELLAKEPQSATAAIEEYRQLLKLDPFRVDAYHALYKLYDQMRQLDRQFCVASVLVFLQQATNFEKLFVSDAKLPADTNERLGDSELGTLLTHAGARSPLLDVMRLIGDQLYKLYPGDLDSLGLGRGDKLKPDHALAKVLRAMCATLSVERFEIYQGKRGANVTLENTDPQSVVIGLDFVRKYQTRDQRFLFARVGLVLRNRNLLSQKLSAAELTNLLGASLRASNVDIPRFGTNDPDFTKRVRKALPNKVLKELEQLRPALERGKLDVATFAQGLNYSADRAGLLFSGDVAGSLNLLLREDPQVGPAKIEGFEQLHALAARRADLRELMNFAISDDFFRLRQRMRMAIAAS